MSTEPKTEETKTEEPVKQPEPTPQEGVNTDIDKINQPAVLEALRKTQEQLMHETKNLKEENKKLLLSQQERDERLKQALFPEQAKKSNPYHQTFIEQPDVLFSTLKEVTKEEVLNELKTSQASVNEVNAAARAVLADRPDITGDSEALEIFSTYVDKAKSAKPEISAKEAMQEALKKFDKLADKYGFSKRLEEQRAGISSPAYGQAGLSAISAKDVNQISVETLKQERERKLKLRNRLPA